MKVVSSGLSNVHHKPSVDRLYLTVRSRRVSSQMSPRYSQRFRNSDTNGVREMSES